MTREQMTKMIFHILCDNEQHIELNDVSYKDRTIEFYYDDMLYTLTLEGYYDKTIS